MRDLGAAGVDEAGETAAPIEPRSALANFARVIEDLIQVRPREFWGENMEFVRAAMDDEADEFQAEAHRQVAEARLGHHRRFDDMAEEPKSAAMEAAAASRDREARVSTLTVMAVDCPACDGTAVLSGEVTDVDVAVDNDGGTAYPVLAFVASGLSCYLCELRLDGARALSTIGVAVESEIEDDDIVRDWMDWANAEMWAQANFGE